MKVNDDLRTSQVFGHIADHLRALYQEFNGIAEVARRTPATTEQRADISDKLTTNQANLEKLIDFFYVDINKKIEDHLFANSDTLIRTFIGRPSPSDEILCQII